MEHETQAAKAQEAEWDRRTGCLLWSGPCSAKHGRPIRYVSGYPVLVSRASWAAVFGQPPKSVQLKNVCGQVRCVSPYHWAIRSPIPCMKRLGLSSGLLIMVSKLVERMSEAGEMPRVTWKGSLAGLECDPQDLFKVCHEVPGLPGLAALAAYAKLLWSEDRERPASVDALALQKLEARIALRLLERGAAIPQAVAVLLQGEKNEVVR